MITWTSLISGAGVKYNFLNDRCCNGFLTTGLSYFDGGCCGTIGYAYSDAMCCDGAVVEGLSKDNGDSCPTETGMYVSH